MKKLILIVLLIFTMSVSITMATAFADTGESIAIANLDETDVLADLMTSDTFDVEDYSFSADKDVAPVLISFVEYCYSTVANYHQYYGLYLYIFNPAGDFLANDGHSINIATEYTTTPQGESKPTQYETFELRLLDTSDNNKDYPDKTIANMFWKFKVVDKVGKDGYTIQQRVNATERRYDVVGVQLTGAFEDQGETVIPKDFQIGCSYRYSGFANGMSMQSSNPLVCQEEHLDTITLDVNSTYYRTETHKNGDGWQNDIHAVYFSVPKTYFSKYGELKRIKAEWYEFVTQKILVTNNLDFYNTAKNFIGKADSQKYSGTIGSSLTFELPYVALANYKQQTTGLGTLAHHGSWGWGFTGFTTGTPVNIDTMDEFLWYLFYVQNYTEYNPALPIEQQGGISAERLEEYVNSFVSAYPDVAGETMSIGGKVIPKALFQDISEERKTKNSFGIIQSGFDGKSSYDFDIEVGGKLGYETFDWSNASFSEKVSMLDGEKWAYWNVFWNNIPTQELERDDIDYITTIDYQDLSMENEEFSQSYLINAQDVQQIKDFATAEHSKGNVVILFRFAVTDYYSEEISLMQRKSNTSQKFDDPQHQQGYVAQASAFLNFDIIQLTFKDKGGNYHAIGVVADPINIYPDITPPVLIEAPSLNMDWVQVLQLFFYIAICVAVVVVVGFTISLISPKKK